MNFGPQRGHIAGIFDNFFQDFGLLIVAMVVTLIQGDMTLLMENVGVLVIILLGPVTRLIGYFTTYYSIDEEKVLIKSGLFKKSSLEVPISTITTVDFSQNIFHQVFGVYKLNIDNSSNISNAETKIHMTLSRADAERVKKLLMKGRAGLDGLNLAGEMAGSGDGTTAGREAVQGQQNLNEQVIGHGRKYTIKYKDLFIMGALKSKGIFFFELIGFAAAAIALLPISEETELAFLDKAALSVDSLGIGVLLLALATVIFVLAVLCGMVGSFVQYYGYKVLDNGEALKIEYGLLNRKTYTLPKKKICGFYYEQSVLMRLMKVGTLNLMAVGYGIGMDEETNEESVLFPLIKDKEVKEAIGTIMPEMTAEAVYQKAERKGMRYFFIRFSVFFTIIFLGVCMYLPKVDAFFDGAWVFGTVLLLMSLLNAFLSYRCAAVYGVIEHFSFVYGGFKKRTVFVKTSMIESIESGGSTWKRKRGIINISIGCIAPLELSEQGVDNMPIDTYEKLKELLIY